MRIINDKPKIYYRALGVSDVLYPPNVFKMEVFNHKNLWIYRLMAMIYGFIQWQF